MRASIEDIATLNSIDPENVSVYLGANNWHKEQDISTSASIWVITKNNREVELFLPQDPSFKDFASGMSKVLKKLEIVEDRSQIEIFESIQTARINVVRVRVESDDIIQGSIPVYDGVQLFTSAKKMMWSSAESSIVPKPYFQGGMHNEVKEYLNKLRFGPSEPGSYILKLLSPSQKDNGLSNNSQDTPFGDRVIQVLFNALGLITNSPESFLNLDDQSMIEDLVQSGVSYNLVESILDMGEISKSDDLGFNLSKSVSFTQSNNVPSKINVRREKLPALSEMSQRLKSKKLMRAYKEARYELTASTEAFSSQEPMRVLADISLSDQYFESISIRGRVNHMEWRGGNNRPEISLSTVIEGREREVTIKISQERFLLATKANIDGRSLYCQGDIRGGRLGLEMHDPNVFEII